MTEGTSVSPRWTLRSARLERRVAVALVVVIALMATVDYVRRSARVITDNDPAELQVMALAGGVPHGTSYPLYVYLLRAFTAVVPVGSHAFRCNVFSAVCGGLSLLMLAALTAELDRKSRARGWIAGAFAAAVVAYSHSFTGIASFTGMYTLHTLMAFAGLAVFVRWVLLRHGRDLEIALAIFGAMMANHIMTLALAPAVLVVMLWTAFGDRSQWKHVMRGIGWAVLCVLVFDVFLFFLLWRRHVPFDHWWGHVLHAADFFEVTPEQGRSFWFAWWYEATCRQFRFDTVGATWAQRSSQLALIVPRLCAEVSPAVAVASIVGLVRLAVRKQLALVALFVLVWITHVYLATGYTATVKTHIYLLPTTLLAAALAGHGLLWPLEYRHKLGLRVVTVAPALTLAALCVWLALFTHARYAAAILASREPELQAVRATLGPRVDAHDDTHMIERARRIVDQLPPKSLVFSDWDVMHAIHYVARYERKTHEPEIYDPWMYGRPKREFVRDFFERMIDPNRTERIFFVGRMDPPHQPGFHVVRVGGEVSEWVKDD